MKSARLKDLFLWELTRIGRAPLLWLTLSIMTVGFIWGAHNAAALHRQQNASIQETHESRAAWYGDIKARIAEYGQPSQTPLKYWQDPTDIDAFSRYFLRESAIKPHLALSPLSVGESALLPFILPVKLETQFGIEPAYEFRHPRGLALGLFDLSFAIVYLLPIAASLLVAMIGAFERDYGILRLAAAQSVTPRVLIGSRLLALAVWFVPGILISITVALVTAGVTLGSAPAELAATLLLVACYLLFWMALGYCVLLRQAGAAASAGILISLWTVFTIIIPVSASLLASILTTPPRHVQYVNAIREVKDQTLYTSKWNDIIRDWLGQQPGDYPKSVVPSQLTFAAHLVFNTPEQERLLAPIREQLLSGPEVLASWTPLIESLSPPTALQHSLSVLAGTDAQRHKRFQNATRAYQLQLRELIYPLIKRQILDPIKTRCPGCAAKMVFTGYDEIPTFQLTEPDVNQRLEPVLRLCAILALIAIALGAFGTLRARTWRAGEFD